MDDLFATVVTYAVVYTFCAVTLPVNLVRGMGDEPVHLFGYEQDGVYMTRMHLYKVMYTSPPEGGARALVFRFALRRPKATIGDPVVLDSRQGNFPNGAAIRGAILEIEGRSR
jgi:hypothetical protein